MLLIADKVSVLFVQA